jgi:hypothetical protein
VCFLLLALPFQAFASASMRPIALQLPAHPQPATVAQLPPCHQGMAMATAMDATVHDGHDDHAGQPAKSKCGTCAACCVGAVMASGLSTAPVPAPPRFVSIPFRAGFLPSVDPVLPERPPSALHA